MAVVRLDAPHAIPMYNVYSQLVYALKGSDVQHVVVNGRAVVKNRRVLTLNMPQVLAKAAEYQRAVAASIGR
jgi:5-methylthioadenosine/S-adenosylhomocysteine deaminase